MKQHNSDNVSFNGGASENASANHHDFHTSPLDSRGNFVAHHNTLPDDAVLTFEGRNNRVVIDGSVPLTGLKAHFLGDNGQLVIGSSDQGLNIEVVVAENANVVIGENVATDGALTINTVPEARVAIGSGCYFRTEVSIDADAAASLDASSENVVTIEDRVLVTGSATQFRAGAHVGAGSVLEMTPIIDEAIPEASLVRGLPATVVRKASWSREHLPRG